MDGNRLKETAPPLVLNDEVYLEFLLSEANISTYLSSYTQDAMLRLWGHACAQYIGSVMQRDGSMAFDPKLFIDMIPRSVLTQLGFASAACALARGFIEAYDCSTYYDAFYAARSRLLRRPEVRFKVWDRMFPNYNVPYKELAANIKDQLKEWKDENAYNRPIPRTEDVMFVLEQMWFVSCTARWMAEAEERWRN